MPAKKTAKSKSRCDGKVGSESEEPSAKKKPSEKVATVQTDASDNSSVVKYYETLQRGCYANRYRYSVKVSLINQIKNFRVTKAEGPFSRRVTFIEWHPNNPRLLAVASKGGDIILWNFHEPIESCHMIKGMGKGGSVQAMKFDAFTPHKIYSVSVEGKLLYHDFHTKKAVTFLDTLNYKKWYVSLDIHWNTKTMLVGDNKGELTILTTDGKVVDKTQIHKNSSRVTHVEFSKREPWLFCTTSNDRTIKIWDIRQLKRSDRGAAASLHVIEHEKPVNSVYFSLTDGCRLLTTDQFDKVHVYRSPLWNLETEINHPHRQFQHLTPIRAYWHPLEDIVIVGRYPHVDFPGYADGELRTIDFFDADTGNLLHQHSESGFNGIAVLNRFNITGDAMATGTGTRILIWEPRFRTGESAEFRRRRPDDDGGDGDDDDDDASAPRKKSVSDKLTKARTKWERSAKKKLGE